MGLRAQPRREDRVRVEAGALELIAVGALEIQERPIAGARREPRGDRRAVGAAGAERVDDFRTDLPAARAQARADRGDQVRRAAIRTPSASRAPPRPAAPAAVPRQPACAAPTTSRHRIVQQDRRAVRDAHADRDDGIVGDDDVGLRAGPGTARRAPARAPTTWMPWTCLTSSRRSARHAQRRGHGAPLALVFPQHRGRVT